jgi:hypothetical protein
MQFGVATEISVPAKLGICVSGLPSLRRVQVLCLNLNNTINFLYTLTLNNRQEIKIYKSSSYDTSNVLCIHDKDQTSGQCHCLLSECYKTSAHCLTIITGIYFYSRCFILMFITEIHRVKYRSCSKPTVDTHSNCLFLIFFYEQNAVRSLRALFPCLFQFRFF